MKNYKKMSLRAMMLALATVLLAGFASCSKSDDNSTSQEDSKAGIYATASYKFEPSADELAMFDITAHFTDGNGKEQTETITGKWEKDVTYTSLPAKATMLIKYALKKGVELTKDEYEIRYKYSCSLCVLKADKSVLDSNDIGPNTEEFTVEKGQMEEFATEPVINESFTLNNTPSNGKYIVKK